MNAPTVHAGMAVRLVNDEGNADLHPFLNKYGILIRWRTNADEEEEGYVQFSLGTTNLYFWVNFNSLE